jgi:cytidylate kinase
MNIVTYSVLHNMEATIIFSDNDIIIDLSRYEKGLCDKILIVGFSGSGKSVLAEKLSAKYNLPVLSTDDIWDKVEDKFGSDYYESDDYDDAVDFFNDKLMEYIKHKRNVIIEGLNIADPIFYKESIKYPLVFMGTSAIKSSIRAIRRNKAIAKSKYKTFKDSYDIVHMNFKDLLIDIKKLKKLKLKNTSNDVRLIKDVLKGD